MSLGCEKDCDNLVFHYCSLKSFLEIVKTGKIRFSELTKKNDTDEISYIYSLFERYYFKKCKKFISSPGKLNELFSKEYFSFSLSNNYNSASLWLNYAKTGVAIGFDKQDLIKNFSENNFPDITFSHKDVEYVDINHLGILKDLFDKIIDSKILENDRKKISNEFSKICAFHKSIAWSEESEFRIYFENTKLAKKEYEIKNDYLVPYFDLPFKRNIIKRIYISSNSKLSFHDVTKFLKNYGLFIGLSGIKRPDVKIR